jgi:hypothetical protein
MKAEREACRQGGGEYRGGVGWGMEEVGDERDIPSVSNQ